MEKERCFANAKPCWGIIANIGLTLCVLLCTLYAEMPEDFSQISLIIRNISPWVIAGSTLVAALCNYLLLKDKDFVWLLNSANFFFWLFAPALLSGDPWVIFMKNDGWWYCLFGWAMMSAINFLLFKRPNYSTAKCKAFLGTLANFLFVVFCLYAAYGCYNDMKFQEACGLELKEDWCLAYDGMKVMLIVVLPCLVSCVCNYMIVRGKNLVWALNISNTVFWGVFIYDIQTSNSTFESVPVLMTCVLMWGWMFILNHNLLGSIFKQDNGKQENVHGEAISSVTSDNGKPA